ELEVDQTDGLTLHSHLRRQRPGIPYLYRIVSTGRGEAVTVRAERQAPDLFSVPLERTPLLAGGPVPDFGSPDGIGRDAPPRRQAWVKGNAGDGLVVAAEVMQKAARGKFPDLRGSILARRSDVPAVRTERHAIHVLQVAHQSRHFAAVNRVPY